MLKPNACIYGVIYYPGSSISVILKFSFIIITSCMISKPIDGHGISILHNQLWQCVMQWVLAMIMWNLFCIEWIGQAFIQISIVRSVQSLCSETNLNKHIQSIVWCLCFKKTTIDQKKPSKLVLYLEWLCI